MQISRNGSGGHKNTAPTLGNILPSTKEFSRILYSSRRMFRNMLNKKDTEKNDFRIRKRGESNKENVTNSSDSRQVGLKCAFRFLPFHRPRFSFPVPDSFFKDVMSGLGKDSGHVVNRFLVGRGQNLQKEKLGEHCATCNTWFPRD